MIAHALLAVLAAAQHTSSRQPPEPDGLIALTCNEIRRLFTTLIIEPARAIACPAELVTLAPPTPLPAPRIRTISGITIYGWSIR